MNFWGFSETIFLRLRAYFENFLRNDAGENLKAECLLPVMVGEELEKGTLEVSVLHSADRWFGMTYHEDRPGWPRSCASSTPPGPIPRRCGTEKTRRFAVPAPGRQTAVSPPRDAAVLCYRILTICRYFVIAFRRGTGYNRVT